MSPSDHVLPVRGLLLSSEHAPDDPGSRLIRPSSGEGDVAKSDAVHAGEGPGAEGDVADSGAIVVPSQYSERLCAHLAGVRGWLKKWDVTEYEPDAGARAGMRAEPLHALHLLPRGARVLNALAAGLPGRGEYDLSELLVVDDGCAESLSRRLEHLTSQQGASSSDEKVLRNLSRACADIREHTSSGLALWMPGLRFTSPACHRPWDAALYEAWHACKSVAPAPTFTFIELFAGIGGFREGLGALGGRCVFACELSPHVRATYQRNHGGPAQPLVDVRCIDASKIPAFDILTAGFPCQSFTEFNPRREGLSSEGGQLVNEVVRILRDTQPPAALLENVPGLLTVHGGSDFALIVAGLRHAGYAVGWQLVSAEHFVPQRRLRVYIVCIRRDLYEPGRYAQPQACRKAASKEKRDGDCGGEALIRWLEIGHGGHFLGAAKPVVRSILQTSDEAPERYTLTEDQWAKVTASEGGPDAAGKRLVNLDGPAKTLRSSYKQDFTVQSEFVPQPGARPRFFTPRECARLMGFPDGFQPGLGAVGFPRSFTASASEGNFYHQLGNAVVPPVVEAIGARILEALPREAFVA